MRRITRPVLGLAIVLPVAGCAPSDQNPRAVPPTLPSATPCTSRGTTPTPRPTPTETRLAWRAEEMRDGSVRLTLGDVDKAPPHPEALRTTDYRRPLRQSECDEVRITKVKGWWCTTSVEKIAVTGEIVVGGATPRATLQGAGFATECSGRPKRMRQVYRIERDSWSGWRGYGTIHATDWTDGQNQKAGRVSELCPQGRVGTYNYRLRVTPEIDGIPVGTSLASSARIRTHCGTGVS